MCESSWNRNERSAIFFSDDFFGDVCGREDKKSRARLRPNVGRSEVRLCRWTSLSRAFRPSRRGLFLLLTKEKCRHRTFLWARMPLAAAARFQFIRDLSSGIAKRRGKARRCIWIRRATEITRDSFHLYCLLRIRKCSTTWSKCEVREREGERETKF